MDKRNNERNKIRTFVIVLFLAVLVSQPSFGEDEFNQNQSDNEIKLHFDYIRDLKHPQILDPDLITNSALFAHDLLINTPLRLVRRSDISKSKKIMSYIALGAVDVVLDGFIFYAAHEYGHYRDFSRLGFNDFVSRSRDSVVLIDNPFDLWQSFLENEFYKNQIYSASILSRGSNKPINSVLYVAGLNQTQYKLEVFNRRTILGESSISDIFLWGLSITEIVQYSPIKQGDIQVYRSISNKSGFNLSDSEIRNGSLIRLLSGSSLAMISGVRKAWLNGDLVTIDKPPRLTKGNSEIYWPEFAYYLTNKGLDYKVTWPIFYGNNLELFPSLQTSTVGNTELGLELKNKGLDLKLYSQSTDSYAVSLGKKFGIGIFEFGGDVYYHSGDTLYREILGKIPFSLAKNDSGYRVYVGINLKL